MKYLENKHLDVCACFSCNTTVWRNAADTAGLYVDPYLEEKAQQVCTACWRELRGNHAARGGNCLFINRMKYFTNSDFRLWASERKE